MLYRHRSVLIEEDWQRVEKVWTDRWEGELDRPRVTIEGLDAAPGINISNTHDLGLRVAEPLPGTRSGRRAGAT